MKHARAPVHIFTDETGGYFETPTIRIEENEPHIVQPGMITAIKIVLDAVGNPPQKGDFTLQGDD